MYVPKFAEAFCVGKESVDILYKIAKNNYEGFLCSDLEERFCKLEGMVNVINTGGNKSEKVFLQIGELLRYDKILAAVAYSLP